MSKSDSNSGPPLVPMRLALAVAGVMAAFAFLFALQEVRSYDIWWHLRTGQWILDNGRIPTTDIFSFTAEGAPWTPHYWLTDIALVSVYGAGGASGLVIAIALVLAAAFGVAAFAMTRRGVNPFLVAALLGLAVVVARFRFMARPHIVMFLFVAVSLHMLAGYRPAERRRLLWLVPITWLWANAHASFVLAIVLFGALFAEELVAWVSKAARRQPDARPPTFVAGVFGALVVVTLLTPLGFELWRWIIDDFMLKSVTRGFEIEEHAALRWGHYPLYWGLLLVTIASFALAWRRARVFHALIVAAFAVLAFSSLRYVGIASLVHAFVLGANLRDGLGATAGRWLQIRRSRQAYVLIPLLIAGAWFAFTRTFTADKAYRFGVGLNERRYPGAAVNFLRDIGYQGRILNSWEYGGYLLWHLRGVMVFTDGRSLPGHMEALTTARRMSAREFATYVDDAGIDAALIKKGDEPFAAFFAASPSFDRVFFDDQGVVFLRKELAQRLAGKVQQFRLIRPDSYDVDYLVGLARGPQAAAAEAELRAAIQMNPGGFHAHFMLGYFLELQQREEALEAYERAIQLNPGIAYSHYQLGARAARVALAFKHPDRAIALLTRSLAHDDTPESRFLLAKAYYEAGRKQEAEAALGATLEAKPDHLEALVLLGFLYFDEGKLEASVRKFARAHELAPDDHNAHYGLALATDGFGKRAEAKQLWREFLDKYPKSPWAERARARLGP